MCGELHLIVGPMFSGKSTELLRQIHRYRSIGCNVIVVNHALNSRYDSRGITTHDSGTAPEERCVVATRLGELLVPDSEAFKQYERAQIIFVEELQFFPDAHDVVRQIVEGTDKSVVAAGLTADYRREPFGDVLRLLPHADRVTHLRGLCCQCRDGTPGAFTRRISGERQTTLVGAAEAYEVVCRRHYMMPATDDCENSSRALALWCAWKGSFPGLRRRRPVQ